VRKKARRKQPKRPRRRDEQSLYFLIERDLDRETFLAEHDGWYSQVSAGRGVIDYAIRYGNLVLGVEVKSGFPKLSHFQQVVNKYRDSFDALYLAYPADRAAEAFYVANRGGSREFSEIGIISIALYRTHCIRRALVVERENDEVWEEFDEQLYRKNISEYINRAKVRIVDSIFAGTGHIILTERDWRSLAVLYGMSRATSVDKFHSLDKLQEKYRKDLRWKGYVNYSNLLDSTIVYGRFYGRILGLFSLAHETYYRRGKLRQRLREEIGHKDWKRLNEQIKNWKDKHRRQQKEMMKEILRFPK